MKSQDKQKDFLELYERYHNDLSRFALALTADYDNAHDLISDTLEIAYKNFEKIKKKDSFKSYLFTVASRLHKKKNWRQRFFTTYNSEEVENAYSVEADAERDLDIEFLYKSLNKLPEKMKEALVLFEISGFSLEEIKKIQGGSLSGVKSRLSRGREKLSQIMNDEDNRANFYEASEKNQKNDQSKKSLSKQMPAMQNALSIEELK